MKKYKPLSVWFIGLPCSGKSTISQGVYSQLVLNDISSKLLDGDELRHGLNSNLSFTISDRYENCRRVAEVNKLFLQENYIVLNALICPLLDMRKMICDMVGKQHYVEIFVNAPLEICEQRDVKGMYKKARAGEIIQFTGFNSPFEPPVKPDVVVKTDQQDIKTCTTKVLDFIKSKIIE